MHNAIQEMALAVVSFFIMQFGICPVSYTHLFVDGTRAYQILVLNHEGLVTAAVLLVDVYKRQPISRAVTQADLRPHDTAARSGSDLRQDRPRHFSGGGALCRFRLARPDCRP